MPKTSQEIISQILSARTIKELLGQAEGDAKELHGIAEDYRTGKLTMEQITKEFPEAIREDPWVGRLAGKMAALAPKGGFGMSDDERTIAKMVLNARRDAISKGLINESDSPLDKSGISL
jgi:hypothetical protein